MSEVEALRAQIAQDELQAYRAMLGYPERIDRLNELEPATLTVRWSARYHQVVQRMVQEPGAGWLARRQAIAAKNVVYHWKTPELVADCGPANVYPAKHIAAWDPVRVLAECQSKRRRIDTILAQLEEWATGWHDSRDREKAIEGLLELLRLEQ